MKKILLSSFIALAAITTYAQKDNKLKFGIGGEFGVVTGNLRTGYSAGLGPSVHVDYAIDEKLTATLQTGYMVFIGKKINTLVTNNSIGSIPILAGAKYYFIPSLYGSAQLGVSIFTASGNKSTKFNFVPGIGYKINDKFDVLVKYTGYIGQDNNVLVGGVLVPSTSNGEGGVFGIRVGYTL
ncbi:MAG: outer membrane beta-barrel protein [Ferruginibacter sp.]|nr:outer membrane beta-barrel protein [Ferruginibacter sp.]